jgi:hypothetical protein
MSARQWALRAAAAARGFLRLSRAEAQAPTESRLSRALDSLGEEEGASPAPAEGDNYGCEPSGSAAGRPRDGQGALDAELARACALFHADEANRLASVERALEMGANPRARLPDGASVLSRCLERGALACALRLAEAGARLEPGEFGSFASAAPFSLLSVEPHKDDALTESALAESPFFDEPSARALAHAHPAAPGRFFADPTRAPNGVSLVDLAAASRAAARQAARLALLLLSEPRDAAELAALLILALRVNSLELFALYQNASGLSLDDSPLPGLSPLRAAALLGEEAALDRLLGLGADPNGSGDGWTPLGAAAQGLGAPAERIARRLIASGGDPRKASRYEFVSEKLSGEATPADIAWRFGSLHAARALIEAGSHWSGEPWGALPDRWEGVVARLAFGSEAANIHVSAALRESFLSLTLAAQARQIAAAAEAAGRGRSSGGAARRL